MEFVEVVRIRIFFLEGLLGSEFENESEEEKGFFVF